MSSEFVIDSDKFHSWKKDVISVEISDLQWTVFPQTITVRSTLTDMTRVFIRSNMIPMGYGEDMEVGGYEYLCPGSGLPVIQIIND